MLQMGPLNGPTDLRNFPKVCEGNWWAARRCGMSGNKSLVPMETRARVRKRKFIMKTKTGWLYLILLTAVMGEVGCSGGGNSAVLPGPAVLTMYNSSANFGDVAVGNTVTVGVTFANTGGMPLTLVQKSVSGTGFATSGVGAGVILDPGQYTTLSVNFNPLAAGNATGSVYLASTSTTAGTSSNPGITSIQPVTIPLSGNGVIAAHLVTFGWMPSTSPVVGYNVYLRSPSGSSWTLLNSTPIESTTFTDVDVQCGQSYMFSVTSVGPTNMESPFSNATEATVPSPE
jgi:hypothetical protein